MSSQKKRLPRSPTAPIKSLEEVFKDVTLLYSSYSYATFSTPEMAHTLKVSATSGPSLSRFSALRQYGLIETSKGENKVSDLFHQLQKNAKNSSEFKTAAFKAIQNAPVLKELLSQFKGTLPPLDTIAKRLETGKKFNADTAKKVATALENSLRFAGVLGASNNILPIKDGDSTFNAVNEADEADVDEGLTTVKTKNLKMDVPLSDGRIINVSYPHDLTIEEAERLANVLKAIVI